MSQAERNGENKTSQGGDRDLIEAAIRKAVRRAVWEHKMLGNPVCTWRDGKVVWIQPEDIEVEKPEDNGMLPKKPLDAK